MKYIKIFEEVESRYYILFDDNETMVKVIDDDYWDNFQSPGSSRVFPSPYLVKFIDGNVQWISRGKFKREMTEEEIDFFEKELEIIKINITYETFKNI